MKASKEELKARRKIRNRRKWVRIQIARVEDGWLASFSIPTKGNTRIPVRLICDSKKKVIRDAVAWCERNEKPYEIWEQ